MEKNICKQACSFVFVQENYIKAHVLMYFLHLVLTFTAHYIIMVKDLYTVFITHSKQNAVLGICVKKCSVNALHCCVDCILPSSPSLRKKGNRTDISCLKTQLGVFFT